MTESSGGFSSIGVQLEIPSSADSYPSIGVPAGGFSGLMYGGIPNMDKMRLFTSQGGSGAGAHSYFGSVD